MTSCRGTWGWGGTLLLLAMSADAAPVGGQGSWETTLHARDLDANPATVEAYYDSALDITWLADANYARTSGYDSDGLMSWDDARAWIESLNTRRFLGSEQWRLPSLMDMGGPGCDPGFSGTDCGYNVLTSDATTVYSEMASMFYDTLANTAFRDTAGNANQPGWGLVNTGPFVNIQPAVYWTGVEYVNPDLAWFNSLSGGRQDAALKSDTKYAWAVVSGNLSTVPLPAAVWLFSAGLIALAGVAGRRRGLT